MKRQLLEVDRAIVIYVYIMENHLSKVCHVYNNFVSVGNIYY